jgi:hypothetical protein
MRHIVLRYHEKAARILVEAMHDSRAQLAADLR